MQKKIIFFGTLVMMAGVLCFSKSEWASMADNDRDYCFDVPMYKIVQKQYIELDVVATAYWYKDPIDASGTGVAYDGNPAVPYETIAVDPKVIPLGSKVYVPGIGWCKAHDTGSAIKGNKIDVAMDSRQAALNWGNRKLRVRVMLPNTKYVLQKVSDKSVFNPQNRYK